MAYQYDPQKITYFAATDSRGKKVPFGIRANDRLRHMYVIGKSGVGKSTMLENLAIQDIQNGEGLCFIDPHGGTAEKLLEYVPEERIKDVMYFAPFDTEYPVGFNIMEDVGYDKRHLVVAGLMSAFKRIWVDAWSARMEYILQNTLLALLEYPGTTLVDVNRMLINKKFREEVTAYVKDPVVKRFWAEEFAGYSDRYTQDATPAIQNKIGQFASNPLVRNIIAQERSTFDIREIMDTNKILIVNLSKGRMGEQNADLLGSILTTKIYLAAMSRADESATRLRELPPFYLYVDEFQSVVNDSFANILSEARKYKLALIIAHQYIEQVEDNIRNAVFGNAGTIVSFRVGPFDAEVLKTVFEPTFYAEDLVNLGMAQIYLTMMIDGMGSQPFSATTLPPVDEPPYSFVPQIIEHSRATFAHPRAKIEAFIARHDSTPAETKPPQTKFQKGSTPSKHQTPDNRKNGLAERDNGNSSYKKPFTKPPQPKPAPTNDDLRNTLQKIAGAQKQSIPKSTPLKAPPKTPPTPQPVTPKHTPRASTHKPPTPQPPRKPTLPPPAPPQPPKESPNHLSLREAIEHVRPAGQETPTPIKPLNQTPRSAVSQHRTSHQQPPTQKPNEVPEKTLRDLLKETNT